MEGFKWGVSVFPWTCGDDSVPHGPWGPHTAKHSWLRRADFLPERTSPTAAMSTEEHTWSDLWTDGHSSGALRTSLNPRDLGNTGALIWTNDTEGPVRDKCTALEPCCRSSAAFGREPCRPPAGPTLSRPSPVSWQCGDRAVGLISGCAAAASSFLSLDSLDPSHPRLSAVPLCQATWDAPWLVVPSADSYSLFITRARGLTGPWPGGFDGLMVEYSHSFISICLKQMKPTDILISLNVVWMSRGQRALGGRQGNTLFTDTCGAWDEMGAGRGDLHQHGPVECTRDKSAFTATLHDSYTGWHINKLPGNLSVFQNDLLIKPFHRTSHLTVMY